MCNILTRTANINLVSVILKTVPSLEFCDGIWWLVQRFGLKKLKRGCHRYFWDTPNFVFNGTSRIHLEPRPLFHAIDSDSIEIINIILNLDPIEGYKIQTQTRIKIK